MDHKPGLVHPESPNRLRSLYRMLDKDFNDSVIYIEPESATLEQLELVHTPAYIKQIMSTAGRDFTTLAPDTPVSANTYIAAWLAVGGCIKALEALLAGQLRACFCMVRPPGHHALADRAGGFCIFNNLGVTAKYAVEKYGYKRILIIDWDIHHGNALQDLFYRDNRVLYLSSHYMGWYPHTGDWEETGEGEGLGYNVNLPVPKELEDNDIIHIYREILGRVVRRWKPELIFVAAGFDAHEKDPLGRTRLTEKAYLWLTQMVLQLSDSVRGAPILMALEGGYDLWALASSVREVLGVLTFQGRRDRIPLVSSRRGSEVVARAMSLHEKYGIWTA
ncbi:MAG: histone deacetylase [Desulfomonile tiedjei]|uniref:Histone deacetylase n=1 Tax=Desulfomonile tiedjei TaxID=2358 RepID=A0A9D6V2W3_9BACT|nr:histone deacetylase [Desulfomonile tiedjei]